MTPTSTARSEAGGHPLRLSFPELVLQPQSFSAVLTTSNIDDGPSSSPDSSIKSSRGAHHDHDHGHIARSTSSGTSPPHDSEDCVQHPLTLTDQALNNVTYDTILASTARGLRLDVNAQYLHPSPSPLPSTDARAPPNTPASPHMARYGSLANLNATTKFVESD